MSRSISPGRTPGFRTGHVADQEVDQRVDLFERERLDVLRLVQPEGRDLELDQVVEAGLGRRSSS